MHHDIEAALRQGRWGEIVTIEVMDNDGDGSSNSSNSSSSSAVESNTVVDSRATSHRNDNPSQVVGSNNEVAVVSSERHQDPTHSSAATTTTTTTPMRSTGTSISLTPCLDVRHGGFQWNPITPQDQELSHFLRTKQWIFPMLNDHVRNKAYQDVIEKALATIVHKYERIKTHKTSSSCSRCDNENDTTTAEDSSRRCCITILDIGCGTGLWGMVAARWLQDYNSNRKQNIPGCFETELSFRVLSIDMSRYMAQMAQQVVRDNHLQPYISVQEVHSMQLPEKNNNNDDDINEPVVLCISELLEHGLLGEGWLPTMRNLLERGIISDETLAIPSSATVYAQAVQTMTKAATETTATVPFCGDYNITHLPQEQYYYNGWSFEYWGPHDSQFVVNKENDLFLKWPMVLVPATSVVLPVHARTLREKGRMDFLSDAKPVLQVSSTIIPQQQRPEPKRHLDSDVVSPPPPPPPQGRAQGEHRRTRTSIVFSQSGCMDAILVWWKLDLDDDGVIFYSSLDPNREEAGSISDWQDHWQPCLHILEKPIWVSQGDEGIWESWHTDDRIHVSVISTSASTSTHGIVPNLTNIDASNNEAQPSQPKRPRRSQGTKILGSGNDFDDTEKHLLKPMISPLRARQLNNAKRLATLQQGLEQILQSAGRVVVGQNQPNLETTTDGKNDLVILDISDFCLCGILAAQLAVKHGHKCAVFSIESSSSSSNQESPSGSKMSLPVLSAQMAQENLSAATNMEFQVIQCHPEAMSQSVLFGHDAAGEQVVDLVVAEPYYEMTETWPIVSAMNFYNIVRQLYEKKLISPQTTTRIFPASARICACAVSSPNLLNAYQPCGKRNNSNDDSNNILGLNHSFVNTQRRIRGQGHIVLSLPMWQYRYTKIGPSVCLTTLRYDQFDDDHDVHSIMQGSSILPIYALGNTCHGIMVWVEFDLVGNSSSMQDQADTILSTDEEHDHQLVVLLEKPMEIPLDSQGLVCNFHLHTRFSVTTTPFSFQLDIPPNAVLSPPPE